MKHVTISNQWKWSEEPFPAFRAELVFGRHKWDREFLPVKNVYPVVTYTVTAEYKEHLLYKGTSETEAKEAEEKWDKRKIEEKDHCNKAYMERSHPTLPENQFRVIKTKEKGTILVVPGEDKTDRCLLFVGCEGGSRGGVEILEEFTTSQILKTCSAGNAGTSAIETICLLSPGQTIVFYSWGRGGVKTVYTYTWDGTKVKEKEYTKDEWDSLNDDGDKEVEIL